MRQLNELTAQRMRMGLHNSHGTEAADQLRLSHQWHFNIHDTIIFCSALERFSGIFLRWPLKENTLFSAHHCIADATGIGLNGGLQLLQPL